MSSDVAAWLETVRARGVVVELDADGLAIGPLELITEDDKVFARANRDALLAAVELEQEDETEADEPPPVAVVDAPKKPAGTGAADPLGAEEAGELVGPTTGSSPSAWCRAAGIKPPPPIPADAPRVVAFKRGFYDGSRRHPGDVFGLRDAKDFSPKWMEPYDEQRAEFVGSVRDAYRAERVVMRRVLPQDSEDYGRADKWWNPFSDVRLNDPRR